MSKRRFVIRTIRNGRVKIYGNWFYPSDQWKKYDGRLDNMRYAFGLYYRGDKMEPFVCLWGSEYAYKHLEEEVDFGPEIVEDNSLPWVWWNMKEGEEWIKIL